MWRGPALSEAEGALARRGRWSLAVAYNPPMTIELTHRHAILCSCLFLMQFGGLWITMFRSPLLRDFTDHVGPAGVAFWLIPLCAGSAFLDTVILFELLRAFTKKR